MKNLKCFIFSLILINSISASAQVIIEESFEGEIFPPQGWTIIDADGDGYNWMQSSTLAPHTGTKCAVSHSFLEGVGELAPHQYLITPQINLANSYGGLFFSYWACTESELWGFERYSVVVSNSGNTVDDFNNGVVVFDGYAESENPHYAYVEIDLSQFSGQNIYIAFKHHQSVDYTSLNIDDVKFITRTAIEGNIFFDENLNLTQDEWEIGLSNWLIVAEPGPFYAESYANGHYVLMVDTGTYEISLQNQNPLWNLNCPEEPSTYTVQVQENEVPEYYNFGLTPTMDCIQNHVDISTWAIRPCFSSIFTVAYQNIGTIASDNTIITVELDTHLTYLSGGNLVNQEENYLTFDVGTVYISECGVFSFEAIADCDFELLNSTMCLEARITPFDYCLPVNLDWDKSSIEVDGYCNGDSIACFIITNTGEPGVGDMTLNSEYRIYENSDLVYVGLFQLLGGENIELCWPAYGNTIRLEADQHPAHPGNSHPNANVEFCGNDNGIISSGHILPWPQDDDDDFVEIFCLQVTGSFDPNDKQVFPSGLTEEYHYVRENTLLEYMIRFQNTGTDTAFNIYIRDTISPYLDIASLESGVSSHPYSIQRIEDNIIQWTFQNVMLPDSNVNEPASHGFVKYKISQMSDNAIGCVITNRAGIIFDFNLPILTNTTFNTIGIPEIVFIAQGQVSSGVEVVVYPNPFSSSVTFNIKGSNDLVTIEIYDLLGRKVRSLESNYIENVVMQRENLNSGVYTYQISAESEIIGCGKLLVK
ncbi:MAG: choice-of-anchor J domain-containing protein [Bacteroidales bacterium]|nr:choice-of-anchor J domain-containing protein [Bacteroidales bacterium]